MTTALSEKINDTPLVKILRGGPVEIHVVPCSSYGVYVPWIRRRSIQCGPLPKSSVWKEETGLISQHFFTYYVTLTKRAQTACNRVHDICGPSKGDACFGEQKASYTVPWNRMYNPCTMPPLNSVISSYSTCPRSLKW